MPKEPKQFLLSQAWPDGQFPVSTVFKYQAPGAQTGWHKHDYDYIVVPGMKGNLLLETTEAENITELEAGQSYYRPAGVEHNVVDANDFPFSFVEIELK